MSTSRERTGLEPQDLTNWKTEQKTDMGFVAGKKSSTSVTLPSPPHQVADQLEQLYAKRTLTGRIKNISMSGSDIRTEIGSASPGLRTVLIGHSYIDQETDVLVDGRSRLTVVGSVVWGSVLASERLTIVKELGVGGERIQDVIDRMGEIESVRPQVIFVEVLINDLKNTRNTFNSPVSGLPYPVDLNQTNMQYAIARLKVLYDRLLKTGATVIVLADTSPANGAPDKNKFLAARTIQCNRWSQWYAEQEKNLYYIPLDRVTYNALDAGGEVKAGHYADTIHPGGLGAYHRGKLIAKTIDGIFAGKTSDRLPWSVIDTPANLTISGTALSCDGVTLTVTLGNLTSGNRNIRVGDVVTVVVPSAGNTQWNGVYQVSSATDTSVSMPCATTGSYTGTVKVCTAENKYDNPLFATQSGGSHSGGTLSGGTIPANVALHATVAGTTYAVAYAAHTDRNGVADGLGYWLDLTVTAPANGEFYAWFHGHRSTVSSPLYGKFFPGDIIRACSEIDVVSMSGVSGANFGTYLQYKRADGTSVSDISSVLGRDATDNYADEPFRATIDLPQWKTPSGGSASLDAVDGQLHVVFGPSGGTINIRVARVGISADRQWDRDSDFAALGIQ